MSTTSHFPTLHLQLIQNYFVRAVARAPKSSHITLSLKSLQWLNIKERKDYKILSYTHKVLITIQPSYLYDLISVRSPCSTRSSNVVIVAHLPSSSSLKVNNRSFRYACYVSSCL